MGRQATKAGVGEGYVVVLLPAHAPCLRGTSSGNEFQRMTSGNALRACIHCEQSRAARRVVNCGTVVSCSDVVARAVRL